jgi:hypothetical protein
MGTLGSSIPLPTGGLRRTCAPYLEKRLEYEPIKVDGENHNSLLDRAWLMRLDKAKLLLIIGHLSIKELVAVKGLSAWNLLNRWVISCKKLTVLCLPRLLYRLQKHHPVRESLPLL